MSQKAARSGGEAQGVCSLGAPFPQWVLAEVLSAQSSEPLREQLSLPQPVEHEEREPRAGCELSQKKIVQQLRIISSSPCDSDGVRAILLCRRVA